MVQLEVPAQTVQRKKQKLKFWLLYRHQSQQRFRFSAAWKIGLDQKIQGGRAGALVPFLTRPKHRKLLYICVTARINKILPSQPEALNNWFISQGSIEQIMWSRTCLKIFRSVETPRILSWLWVPAKTYCLRRLHVEKQNENDILQVSWHTWYVLPL